jgi:hypothetical protein
MLTFRNDSGCRIVVYIIELIKFGKILQYQNVSQREHWLLLTEPWLDEGCSKLTDKKKRSKLQRLQIPSQINEDNLNNLNQEAFRE